MKILTLSALSLLALSACGKSTYSFEDVEMGPGADVAISIRGVSPTVKIRNLLDTDAEITIQSDKPMTTPPPLAISPGATWEQKFTFGGSEGKAELLIHNRGLDAARLQFWTADWTGLHVALFPSGRANQKDVRMIVNQSGDSNAETAAQGWYMDSGAPQ